MANELNLQARPSFLHPAEYGMVTYYMTVAPDIPYEQLMNPLHWSLVARKLRPGNRIVVDCEDYSWTATLMVREASPTEAAVIEISRTMIDKAPSLAQEEGDYEVRWGGPAHKHQVVRLSDGAVVQKGIPTKAAALKYVDERKLVDAR